MNNTGRNNLSENGLGEFIDSEDQYKVRHVNDEVKENKGEEEDLLRELPHNQYSIDNEDEVEHDGGEDLHVLSCEDDFDGQLIVPLVEGRIRWLLLLWWRAVCSLLL